MRTVHISHLLEAVSLFNVSVVVNYDVAIQRLIK
jgi:hypothetical protein